MSVSRRGFLATALALVTPGGPQSPGGSDAEAAGVPNAANAPALPNAASPPNLASSPNSASPPNAPRVSFHLDRPYLDLTGLEKPYIPPAGMRSGAPLAALSDEQLSRFHGFI